MAIKANIRSPFYLKYSDSTLTRAEVNIYVYSGTLETDKGDPIYTLSNDVISGTDYALFEVSEFVRDFFNHTFTGDNYYSNTLWLTTEATLYNQTNVITTVNENFLAFDGYTGYADGINSEGSRDDLITTRTVVVPDNEVIRIPVFSEEVVSVTVYTPPVQGQSSVSIWNENTNQWQIDTDYWDTQASNDTNVVPEIATLSTGKIQYASVPATAGLVTINTNSSTYNIVVKNQCETKFGKRKLTFVNKHGAFQDVWFTGAKTESTEFTSSEYKSSPIDFNTMSYSAHEGQMKRYNVNGSESMVLNSGFVEENMNSAFEELLMSENVWLTENNTTIPVLPIQSSLNKQSHEINGLINYSIGFKKAFNTNNTVI